MPTSTGIVPDTSRIPSIAPAPRAVERGVVETKLLFPGYRGGHLSQHEWRCDVWAPALKAAGLAHRGPYALRHTYASFAIAAGVSLVELARFMGTRRRANRPHLWPPTTGLDRPDTQRAQCLRGSFGH